MQIQQQRQSSGNLKQRIEQYIKTWESRGYSDGIPDCAPDRLEALGLVPSYRRIALAILRNDVTLSSLGYAMPHAPVYDALKKMEIEARGDRSKQQRQLVLRWT